jgi:enolase
LPAQKVDFRARAGKLAPSEFGRAIIQPYSRSALEALVYARLLCHRWHSIEDPLGEDDLAGFAEFTRLYGHRCQVVGDDLFVTNAQRIAAFRQRNLATAVLVKPNQAGTITS